MTKKLPRLILIWATLVLAVIVIRLVGSASHPDLPLTLRDALGDTFDRPDAALLQSATVLALLLLGAWISGRIMQVMHLPRLTGYLFFGVVVGPHLGLTEHPLISSAHLEYLRLCSAMAIALIGLTAGGEIRFELLRSGFRRIVTIAGMDMIFILPMVFATMWFVGTAIAPLGGSHVAETAVICIIVAIVAIANSPAVVVAMLSETQAKGPMAETALAVTVCKDLLLVIVFTVAMALSLNLLLSAASSSATSSLPAATSAATATALSAGQIILNLAWHLLGSIGGGALLGICMMPVIQRLNANRMIVFVLALAIGISLVSEAARLEPLLVALSAGFTLINLWPAHSEPMFRTIDQISMPVYCIFFAMTGAHIRLGVLATLWPLVLLVVLARFVGLWSGLNIATRLTGMARPGRTWLWTAFVPQAGVTIALATTVAESFRDYSWGPTLATLLLSVVTIHEMVGPILFRIGLVRAGEMPPEESAPRASASRA